jgi:amidase
MAPTNSPAWTTDLINGDHFLLGSSTPAAVAGYASITVPVGFSHQLPVGMSLIGGRWAEPKLIALAYAWEHATHIRHAPRFLPTTPVNQGPTGSAGGSTSAERGSAGSTANLSRVVLRPRVVGSR